MAEVTGAGSEEPKVETRPTAEALEVLSYAAEDGNLEESEEDDDYD